MKLKTYKGFTLIELIITISLLSVVVLISTSIITLTNETHAKTVSEYEINTAVRQASQKMNEIVRYSKAVFAVPEDFVKNVSNMDPGWSYYAVSDDKRRVVQYVYDNASSTHVEKVLIDQSPNVEYEIEFSKPASSTNDNMLEFKFVGYVTKDDGLGGAVRTGEKIEYSSEIEAQNSLQVVDKGTVLSPSIALAYRNDSSAQGTGRTQVATVTLVLDISGSMGYRISYSDGRTRIQGVKDTLLGYTKSDGTQVEGILNTFAEENNIEVCVVPFSSTANYPYVGSNTDDEHPYYNAQYDKTTLSNYVLNLSAGGGTNTGDGLRRAYYRLIDFNPVTEGYNQETERYEYIIVLVDGQTNLSSWNAYGYPEWNDYWRYWYTAYHYNYQYTGRGGVFSRGYDDRVVRDSSLDHNNNSYINTIGTMIKNREINNRHVSSYVIGFAGGLTNQIRDIGTAIGAPTEHVYDYTGDFNLDEVFENIAQDIMAEIWLVSGPQIIE